MGGGGRRPPAAPATASSPASSWVEEDVALPVLHRRQAHTLYPTLRSRSDAKLVHRWIYNNVLYFDGNVFDTGSKVSEVGDTRVRELQPPK